MKTKLQYLNRKLLKKPSKLKTYHKGIGHTRKENLKQIIANRETFGEIGTEQVEMGLVPCPKQ